MLDAVALATWIAICLPAADTHLVTVMVQAGSAGEPYLVTDAAGETFVGKSVAEAADHVRTQATADKEFYLGLAQVPLSTLTQTGMSIEDGLDKCGSMEIGYEALLAAYAHAKTIEKTPAKTLAAAFAYYRSRSVAVDLPYAKKAVELSTSLKPVAPMPLGTRQRAEMMAEWAAGFAQRMAHRAARLHDGMQRATATLAQ